MLVTPSDNWIVSYLYLLIDLYLSQKQLLGKILSLKIFIVQISDSSIAVFQCDLIGSDTPGLKAFCLVNFGSSMFAMGDV